MIALDADIERIRSAVRARLGCQLDQREPIGIGEQAAASPMQAFGGATMETLIRDLYDKLHKADIKIHALSEKAAASDKLARKVKKLEMQVCRLRAIDQRRNKPENGR